MRIAIDGPASSGKSSVGRRVAEEFGFGFLDTGLLYRAITRRAIDLGWFASPVTSGDVASAEFAQLRERLTELARLTDVQGSGMRLVMAVDGTPYADAELESSDVERSVPVVAAVASVRDALRGVQRTLASRGGSVLVGRDIGTVVLPDAECKIFLDATAETRATRRSLQRGHPVGSVEHQEILASLTARDADDRTRPIAPLVAAADAVTIHTDDLSLEEVVERVVAVARRFAR